MFTGIVTALGSIVSVDVHGDAARISISGADLRDAALGDSIAVNGVCLTVAEMSGDTFTADLLPETRRRTSLGDVSVGRRVNLELAATPTTRLGGHLVQGHVDAVGSVVSRAPGDAWDDVTVAIPADLARYVAVKGSIALDGVSLTVVDVSDDTLSVSLIPETLRRTTWGDKRVGDPVNVEVDVIAKYVERLVLLRQEQRS